KTGSAGSIMNLLQEPKLNHQVEVTAGILADRCGDTISVFFKRRRQEIKALKQAKREQQS
ncbi:tRNA-specific adenosine deaminase, partial [Streptomyces scabiei]